MLGGKLYRGNGPAPARGSLSATAVIPVYPEKEDAMGHPMEDEVAKSRARDADLAKARRLLMYADDDDNAVLIADALAEARSTAETALAAKVRAAIGTWTWGGAANAMLRDDAKNGNGYARALVAVLDALPELPQQEGQDGET